MKLPIKKVLVTSRCLIKFTRADNIDDGTWCDVVPTDARQIILGRPWFYDKDLLHYNRVTHINFRR